MKKSKMKLNWWRLSRLRANTTTTSPVLMLLLMMMMMMMCARHHGGAEASEFPERECCDPIYPMPDPTSRLPNVPSPTGKTGSDKTTAILNCLYARKLCFEHASCSAILEVIPRVCGPELVACSTVTVSKCQAALKSLQAFEFFKPTCLCHEPHVDPECNDFRDFLFDHKCIYVNKKEKDPYSIEALPTCNHALSECQRDKSCVKLYDDFKTNCKTRDGRCRMENRDACTEAWTQLRLSPMFGCICPDNGAKKRCDRIFSMVNHNPCVGVEPYSASLDLAGTDSALYEDQQQQHPDQQLSGGPKSRHAYPYFLYPNGTEPKVPAVEPGFYELDQELASSLEEQYWRQQQGYGGQEDERQQEATEQGVGGRLKLFLYQESAARGPPSPELSRSLTAIRAYEAGHWRTRWLYVLISPFATSDDKDKDDDNKNNNDDDDDDNDGNDASQRPTKVTTYYRPRAPKHDLREHSYYLTNSTGTNDNNNNNNSTTLHQSHQHETNNHNNNHHLHNHLHNHHHNNHNQHQHQHHQHRHRQNSHLHHLQPHQSTATNNAPALPASGVNGQTTNLELDAASSSSGSALPIDRLKGLREAFEGFIDSGS